jgi:hypothetical protein
MQMQNVSMAKWKECLDQFSRAHHGQEVRVETFAPESGIHCNLHELPLLGVTLESGSDPSPGICIEAGDARRGCYSHRVIEPVQIAAAEWNDGVSSTLEIWAADGRTTRVSVGPAEECLAPGVITDGLWEHEE